MKSLIAILALAVSANVFAYSVTDITVLTSASPLLTSATTSGAAQKEAHIVMNDVQEYTQAGTVSPFLSQKIKEAQEINLGVSEAEAVEMLVNEAQAILADK